jgi:hypothetical protein
LRSLATHADAVCNDGSPAHYYWSSPTQRKPDDDWLIMLDSGGWCWDAASCSARCISRPHLCTSNHFAHSRPATGVLNHFAHSHSIIRVPYCSSDAHLGNTSAFGFEFRGAAVVRAVLHEAVATHGFGSSAGATRLLFGGWSAGARGAMAWLDHVCDTLPIDAATRARVSCKGLLDSAMWIDVEPLRVGPSEYGHGAHFTSFAASTRAFYSWANVPRPLVEACATRHFPHEPWRCLFGQHRLPHVDTPYLAIGSQFDTYQLDHDLGCDHWGCGVPHTADEDEYVWRLANLTVTLARQLTTHANRADRHVYSSRCHRHAVSASTAHFRSPGCMGVSLQEAVENFVASDGTPRTYIDTRACADFDCCCREPQYYYDTLVDALSERFPAGPNEVAAALALLCVLIAGGCFACRHRRQRRSRAQGGRGTRARGGVRGGEETCAVLQAVELEVADAQRQSAVR